MLLIDPGVRGDEMACLANDLTDLGQPVVAGFSTHPHWDHLLWHASLGAAPRYGTARCAATVRARLSDPHAKARIAQLIPPDIVEETPLDLLGLITGLPAETARIPWDGPQIRIIEHQAHAPGHAALLIEERGVLIAGDTLSDVLIPLLDLNETADPIGDYLAALRLLEDAADDIDVLIPGHGSIGGPDRYTHGSNRTGRTCTPCFGSNTRSLSADGRPCLARISGSSLACMPRVRMGAMGESRPCAGGRGTRSLRRDGTGTDDMSLTASDPLHEVDDTGPPDNRRVAVQRRASDKPTPPPLARGQLGKRVLQLLPLLRAPVGPACSVSPPA